METSGIPTWQAQVTGASADDIGALTDLMGPLGLGIDEWSGIRVMCADCSHGSPDTAHSHQPAQSDSALLGLAGGEGNLHRAIDNWLAGRPHVNLLTLIELW